MTPFLTWMRSSPKIFLGDDLPRRLLDHFGSGDEHLAGVAHHHVEMAHARLHGGQSRHGAENSGNDRNELQQLGGEIRARVAGQVGAAHLLEGLDAAARGVEQPHVGDPGLQREPFREAALVADGRVGGTAADGEVAARNRDLAVVDAHGAHDRVGRLQGNDGIVFPLRGAGNGADFVEGTRDLREARSAREPSAGLGNGERRRCPRRPFPSRSLTARGVRRPPSSNSSYGSRPYAFARARSGRPRALAGALGSPLRCVVLHESIQPLGGF